MYEEIINIHQSAIPLYPLMNLKIPHMKKISIPNGFECKLSTMRPFLQDQGVKRRNSGTTTRLCNADIDKMASSKWGTLKCAGYIILLLLISYSAKAQVSKNSDLYRVLKIQDSTFFEHGFNQCDLDYLNNHVTDDLTFYHDKSGIQDRDAFFENTEKYICANTNLKPIRKVDASSLEVFPLHNNGNMYGAIQKGIHHFYLREKGKEDVWTNTAKFTHVWILDNEGWKISEVLSYDHQDPILENNLERKRVRDYGIHPGILTPGKWNNITDVKGVSVGHASVIKGDSVRTGVTVIKPHDGNLFQEKVPAAIFVGNGFGKCIGTTQIKELGNIETPIALTNTLNAHKVADALSDYMLLQKGNEAVRSVNPIVGETNDGWLNDIRGKHVEKHHVISALHNSKSGLIEEGCVGTGVGTRCLGYKGGIGSSSRVLPEKDGGYSIGVLVQSNFGGILTINGAPVGEEMKNHYMADDVPYDVDGSIMVVVATDAPLSPRNLERLSKRAFMALARVGSFASNGSGDYIIAFSTHEECRIAYKNDTLTSMKPDVNNASMSPLFLAVVEATEEAIYNSLFMATDTKGMKGRETKALPINSTLTILKKYNALN